MENIKILQVVGFKNSGKTTLLSRFLEMAAAAQKQVSTIKHHGHGGALEMPDAETDSMRFFGAGAASSLAYGNGAVQLHLRQEHENVEKLIDLSLFAEPDLILIEGFKEADFPKVVIARSSDDWNELQKLSNIKLIIVHEGVDLANIGSISLDDKAEIDRFFAKWMEGETR